MHTLRRWQSKCIDSILQKYQSGNKHFLTVATPGAGKTIMAATVIKKLIDLDMIDFVLVFSPSVEVSSSFSESIAEIVSMPCNGMIGSIGRSLTYQNLSHLSEQFWELLDNYRVLVICDEIHHCSSSFTGMENMWGKALQGNVYDKAAYTLSLSGTPWRSDKSAVALAEYCPNNILKPDFIYGLQEAIQDKVCRHPKIVAIDSNDIAYSEGNENKRHYEAIRDLIENEEIPYHTLLEDQKVIGFMLEKAILRLSHIKVDNPIAGGLIVASNIKHANSILELLVNKYQQTAVIVTHNSNSPTQVIQDYKYSNTQWIVSVGMVSEGTNIPRLQVCCHLTRIKTELHFRQVLGRILRVTPQQHSSSYLYILAEEKLLDYAYRVEDDLPEACVIIKDHELSPPSHEKSNTSSPPEVHCAEVPDEEKDIDRNLTLNSQNNQQANNKTEAPYLKASFQRFYEEILLLQKYG